MIHTADLDLEQLASTEGQHKPIELDVWSYWYENGYPVESIVEAHSVVNQKPDAENTGHIVVKVETLSKPLNRADVVDDTVNVLCCDCRDYQFNKGVDLEQESVTDWGHCKHIASVSKHIKAQNDENQDTL
jgi:hypothetical protein